MNAVTFKTTSNNCYLYSPAQRVVMPIPQYLYDGLLKTSEYASPLLSVLEGRGYLKEYRPNLFGRITESDIKNALLNVSQIVFEMTTNCNLRCEYCCYGEGYTTFKNRKTGNLDFKTAKSVLDYFSNVFENKYEIGTRPEPFAISFYGGEPLMNFPVIKSIVDYAEEKHFKGKDLVFTMTTNAMLLDKYADYLSAHNFRILVSLDGNKAHDSYRKTYNGKESFEIVYRNLKAVEKLYPRLFAAIHFNSVYTDRSDAGEIIAFFNKEFGKTPQFSPLHEPEPNAQKAREIKNMCKPLEIPSVLCMRQDLIMESPMHKRILELCVKLSSHSYRDESQLQNDTRDIGYPTGTCIPFSKRVFVSYNGELHPCEKVNRDKAWGKVDDTGTLAINFDEVAIRFNKMLDDYERVCSSCYLQQFCTKCALQSGTACNNWTSKERLRTILSQTYSYLENNTQIVNLLTENVIIK